MNASGNRLFRRGIATLEVAGLAFFGLVPTMAHAADNVHIPDAPLHACINGEFVQTPDAQITVMQVEPLTMLFCYDEGVVAVTDLSLLDGNIPAEWFS